ncbi:hypothetical protein GCK32_001137 [Trichostrongylus colubriformis]|uniref:Uncharacterized protein n=1 Tax=Trichostrongylus colubriformis TaxID=6319 RepID=A0AAN8IW05_TRICO
MNRAIAILCLLIEARHCDETYRNPTLVQSIDGHTLLNEDFIAKYLAIPKHVPKAGAPAIRYKLRKRLGFLKSAETTSIPETTTTVTRITYQEGIHDQYVENGNISDNENADH